MGSSDIFSFLINNDYNTVSNEEMRSKLKSRRTRFIKSTGLVSCHPASLVSVHTENPPKSTLKLSKPVISSTLK